MLGICRNELGRKLMPSVFDLKVKDVTRCKVDRFLGTSSQALQLLIVPSVYGNKSKESLQKEEETNMKTDNHGITIILGVALVIIFAAFSDALSAGEGTTEKPAHHRFLEKYDQDGDGVISGEEKDAARAEMRGDRRGRGADFDRREEFMKRADTNGDGVLSDEERAQARERMRQRRERFREEALRRFDRDGDGMLSDEERATAREKASERRARFLEEFDTDGDEVLSEEERRKARETFRERREFDGS